MTEKKDRCRDRQATDDDGNEQICFGMDRATDEQSLVAFLRKSTAPELLATLIPRLKDRELNEIVDLLSRLLRDHLSHQEYHRLFLGQKGDNDID